VSGEAAESLSRGNQGRRAILRIVGSVHERVTAGEHGKNVDVDILPVGKPGEESSGEEGAPEPSVAYRILIVSGAFPFPDGARQTGDGAVCLPTGSSEPRRRVSEEGQKRLDDVRLRVIMQDTA
jgi:hypothetical protein